MIGETKVKNVKVVYILLFNESGKQVLMVKNKGSHGSYYTLPGGRVEKGETLKEAAIRETKEETGLDVEIDGIISVNEAFFEDVQHHTVFVTFKGELIGGDITLSRPDEIEGILWMDVSSAEKLIHTPKKLEGLLIKQSTVPYFNRGNVSHKF